MKEQSVSDPSKKYSKLITVVSILIPVVVAVLFTVRLPNVAPLDFLPPIYASINALTALILVVAYVAIRKKKIKLHESLMKTAIALSLVFLGDVCGLPHDLRSHPFWWGRYGEIHLLFHTYLSYYTFHRDHTHGIDYLCQSHIQKIC
jgi:putative membrane protein